MILEFIALIGTCILAYIISKRVRVSTSLPLPPGPPADSIWGNSYEPSLIWTSVLPKTGYSRRDSEWRSEGLVNQECTTPSPATSTRPQDHARRYAAAVIMALAYGEVPLGYEDPAIQALNRCLTHIGYNRQPGAWKVDIFPLLKYVPRYLNELKIGHKEELGLFKGQLQGVRESMGRKEEVPACFGKYLIERQPSLGLSDNKIAYLAGSMFGAGSDTTASTISFPSPLTFLFLKRFKKKVNETHLH
ncbi:hypothetical protein BT96DRAFT_1056796 [Gymnopus androsaceus JB14]|uniref:Cytochrome P450 n=1 Tax=Gymnopus androsaceus JB14 TaxID=1447944 RepID=A0A6A4I3B5_9AGAR|nr:hypothetical protein BT96DRAFT_1056796 [Gymnopus androsaceus JB14]